MTDLIVKVQSLTKRYPGSAQPAILNPNLDISSGIIFGLLGPNGAGKTTLMNCMTGLISFDSGSIHLAGIEVIPHNKLSNKFFGFVPQDFSFYQELSPVQNLEFFGAWSGLHKKEIKERTTELMEVLGLADIRNKPVHKFSGGMKRRVNLAIGVIHHPKILFLDEPTVGVDVQTRYAIIDYLKQLNKNGTTLIYTSHQLNEAEDLCEKIALIDEGKIIACDSLHNLLAEYRQDGLEGLFLNLTGKAYRNL